MPAAHVHTHTHRSRARHSHGGHGVAVRPALPLGVVRHAVDIRRRGRGQELVVDAEPVDVAVELQPPHLVLERVVERVADLSLLLGTRQPVPQLEVLLVPALVLLLQRLHLRGELGCLVLEGRDPVLQLRDVPQLALLRARGGLAVGEDPLGALGIHHLEPLLRLLGSLAHALPLAPCAAPLVGILLIVSCHDALPRALLGLRLGRALAQLLSFPRPGGRGVGLGGLALPRTQLLRSRSGPHPQALLGALGRLPSLRVPLVLRLRRREVRRLQTKLGAHPHIPALAREEAVAAPVPPSGPMKPGHEHGVPEAARLVEARHQAVHPHARGL
mmetsp:Transcript_50990/g.163163  ORF Transcript_50990/g.163163 Transcript_50990/m.163163 type:complete len:330 (-) Transcript_50990:586-1575(-)